MHSDDPVVDLMDRFTAASTTPTASMPSWPWGEMLATTPKAPFSVEEQLSDGSARAVVCWRYDWGDGHVRGVDIGQVRNGKPAESVAYVKANATPRWRSARSAERTARNWGPRVREEIVAHPNAVYTRRRDHRRELSRVLCRWSDPEGMQSPVTEHDRQCYTSCPTTVLCRQGVRSPSGW